MCLQLVGIHMLLLVSKHKMETSLLLDLANNLIQKQVKITAILELVSLPNLPPVANLTSTPFKMVKGYRDHLHVKIMHGQQPSTIEIR